MFIRLPYTYENTSSSQRISNPNRVIPIATVLEFLEFLNQEVVKDEKGKEIVSGNSASSSSSNVRSSATPSDPFRNLNSVNTSNNATLPNNSSTNLFSSPFTPQQEQIIPHQSSSNTSTTSTPSPVILPSNPNSNFVTQSALPQSSNSNNSTFHTSSSHSLSNIFGFGGQAHNTTQSSATLSEPSSLLSNTTGSNPFSLFPFIQSTSQQPSHKRNFDTFLTTNPTFSFPSSTTQMQTFPVHSQAFGNSSSIQQSTQQMNIDHDMSPVTKKHRV